MTQRNTWIIPIATAKRLSWSLNIFVASAWVLTLASIGFVFDDKLALSSHGLSKVTVMSTLIGAICWLGGRFERRRNASHSPEHKSHSVEIKAIRCLCESPAQVRRR
jgi:hypothetical protein